VLLRCHFFQGRSVSVGVSLKKSVVGGRCRCFFKALCAANADTNAVPGTALMLGLASSLPLHIHGHWRRVRGWAVGRQTPHLSTAGRCRLPRLTSKEEGEAEDMRGQLGHLCCRHRSGEWRERSLPRRTQRCETDGSRGQRASLIKANFDREFEHTVYYNEVCNALYSNTGQLNVVLKQVFALLI